MSLTDPSEYVLVGVFKALYAISPSNSVRHSLTIDNIRSAFANKYSVTLSDDEIIFIMKRVESIGIASVIIDPYAETLIEISDEDISLFSISSDNEIISRGWSNQSWLSSALKNETLWNDFRGQLVGVNAAERIPAADGFVTINHNAVEYIEVENAVSSADEAMRGDNEFDSEERGWIRNHLESGIALLKRGGPVLKSALAALIVEPLKAALRATANEKVKGLIGIALGAIIKWLGF